jgi:uncharacterized membrane protein YcaP (DUF421 family)
MEENIFFESWEALARVAVMALCAYVPLVFLLRITGKRTLSKMNAFDFVVTVALGSTLATILLSREVTLSEGVLALAMLIFLQLAVTWLSVRSDQFQKLIKATPRLLYHQGKFVADALIAERVTIEEVLAAARAEGQADLQQIVSVVLETDGTFSIITGHVSGARSTLKNVVGANHLTP